MILINSERIKELVNIMSNVKTLEVTDTPSVELIELKSILNTLALYLPQFDVTKTKVTSTGLTLQLHPEVGTTRIITYSDMLDSLGMTEVVIMDSHKTVSNRMSGLIYSELLDMPFYYHAATSVLLKADNTQVPRNKHSSITNNAIGLYDKFLSEFMPEVHSVESKKRSTISASWRRRGFTEYPKVGDTVVVRSFADMESEYGVMATTPVKVIKGASMTYGVPFIEYFENFCEKRAVITAINPTTGVVSLDGEVDFKTLEITVDDVVHQLDQSPILHETFLNKA